MRHAVLVALGILIILIVLVTLDSALSPEHRAALAVGSGAFP